jgi:hypothetical protein
VAVALARRTPGSRALVLAWNTLGVIDLVTAIGLGTGFLVRLFAPGTPLEPAAAMTMFPLVLVPTFGVPLAIILHLLTYRALARSGANRHGPAATRPTRQATLAHCRSVGSISPAQSRDPGRRIEL